MILSEFIAELSKYNQDTRVAIRDRDGNLVEPEIYVLPNYVVRGQKEGTYNVIEEPLIQISD